MEAIGKIAQPIPAIPAIAPIAPIAPIPAIPAIPHISVMPSVSPSADHDLLTVFRAETQIELRNIRTDIANMQKSASESVSLTDFNEHLKADADHEMRIRDLESYTASNVLVRKLVFGCISIVLSAIVLAIIYLIINK